MSTDLRPELSKIETPVLVLGTWVGLQGYGVTKDSATAEFKEQYAGVKNLDFAMADKARHFVMWDDPAWFNTQVDGFLGGTCGRDDSGAVDERGANGIRRQTARHSTAYWACQLAGWGGYGLGYYFAVLVPFHATGWKRILADAAYCATGLVGTHLLRLGMSGADGASWAMRNWRRG